MTALADVEHGELRFVVGVFFFVESSFSQIPFIVVNEFDCDARLRVALFQRFVVDDFVMLIKFRRRRLKKCPENGVEQSRFSESVFGVNQSDVSLRVGGEIYLLVTVKLAEIFKFDFIY